MEKDKRGWYASGKERKAGNLFKYTLIVLVGVVFAAITLVNMLASAVTGGGSPNIGASILWGFIWAVGAAVVGVIIWFVYKALVLSRRQ